MSCYQKAGVKEFIAPNLTKRDRNIIPADDSVTNVRKYNIANKTWHKFDRLSDAIKSRQQGECVLWDDKE